MILPAAIGFLAGFVLALILRKKRRMSDNKAKTVQLPGGTSIDKNTLIAAGVIIGVVVAAGIINYVVKSGKKVPKLPAPAPEGIKVVEVVKEAIQAAKP